MSKANPFASVPSLSADELFTFLDLTLTSRTVPMIYGAPGIGKSSILAQWAERRGYALLDIRLAQMLPEHIAAIQYVSADHKSAVSLVPAIIGQVAALEGATGKPVLILFDELTLASQETLSAALEIILDRRVSGFKLPDTCLIAAAGNRPQDTSSAMLLDPPVRSRLMSCVYGPSTYDTAYYIKDRFGGYALADLVADFITSAQGRPLMTQTVAPDDAAFVTPRGIVAAIDMCDSARVSAAVELTKQPMARLAFESAVGKAFFGALASFAIVAQTLKNPNDVLGNPLSSPIPETVQGATAQFSAIMQHINKTKDESKRAKDLQDFQTYLERCSVEHLRIWVASLPESATSLLTSTVRGKRLMHDAGISLSQDSTAAGIASSARSR